MVSRRSSRTPADAPADSVVSVLLPLPLKGPYDYRLGPENDAGPGAFVTVPLGHRDVAGVIWGAAEGGVEEAKLRTVSGLLDAPPLSQVSRRFVDWVARYTLSLPGSVLRMVMSTPEALEPAKPMIAYARTALDPEAAGLRMTPARKRVLTVLDDGPPRPATELAREAGVSPGVVGGLTRAGMLEPVAMGRPTPPQPDPDVRGPTLSADQSAAAQALRDAIAAGDFEATLLDGVTGSGKTEVYFEAVAACLAAGRQVLVLLPEIAMSAQWFERFTARFGAPPAAWHSEIPRPRRRQVWRDVALGRVKVVVGARSALFLPFAELGLIVVDEEHDGSYKQEDGVVYHARDMAVVRASLGGFPVVLASATPSLESLMNAEAGRYRHLRLPVRHGGASLPEIDIVDMRKHPPARGRWLSPRLDAALTETLAAGEQAMLFLNRRGYAPLTLCRACGYRIACPRCTAWLVEHRLAGRLECHHCGHAMRPPPKCPSCEVEDAMVACGPGVERVAEEIAKHFPQARLAVMASDTLRGPAAAAELVRRVEDRQLDILIGTQVMAKGHHFPQLTLVGVIDADLGLTGGDPRAGERTFQLL